jgi:RNA polymerase sigma-70 factor, ECF subfamily
MDQKLEEEIVARVINGEKQAYAQLVDAYKGPIFNLAFRMTGSYQDADDLAQETFIRAYKNLWRFDPKRKFFTWLYTISINLIRNHLKKIKNDELLNRAKNIEYAENENKSPETLIIAAQESNKIDLALLTLKYELRVMLIMKYQMDLSFEEIAEITGKSVSAVKMRIYRSLYKLEQLINSQNAK